MRKEPLGAHGNPKPDLKSRRPASAPGPLTDAELARDQRVFRALKRHGLGDEQKRHLFALARGPKRRYTREDYRRYQRQLIRLARAAGIGTGIWPRTKGD